MGYSRDLIDLDRDPAALDFPDLYDKSYKEILFDSIKVASQRIIWFTMLITFCEVVFHIWAFKGFSSVLFLKLFLVIPTAIFLSFFDTYFSGKTNKIITWVETSLVILIYAVHILYHAIFKVFFSVAFIDKANTKVIQYYREIIEGIIDNWFVLLLIIGIPIAGLILLNRFRIFRYSGAKVKCIYQQAGYLVAFVGIAFLMILVFGKEPFSPYDLIFNENISEFSMEKIGVIATGEVEICNEIFPKTYDSDENLGVWVYNPEENPTTVVTSVVTNPEDVTDVNNPDEEKTGDEEVIEEIVEKVIDTSPNILDIDFMALAEAEPDEEIAAIHRYFASVEPSYKNEYTGMFKGYNLIFLTAEGFCNLAVDENITPTLYRLTHEAFVFNNFYNPRTGGSTSDGEFVCSTSLVPANAGAKNFRIVGSNEMPFALGNIFNRTYGITSRAYHNNDFAYYKRDITYPGMGYMYQGVGSGLEIPKHWPSSDYDMMVSSLPEYIDDEIFNVYYMTVSGHLNYNFTGNWCAKHNKEAVENLPYSETCKAYMATQIELDKAMEYLLQQLEEKGIADRTVICFTGDHWPYGLTNEEFSELLGHKVEENFELYKSDLILWCGAIKEPIVVDKMCSSRDILPTLLNLFGFDFDSRLLMGRDIFSNTEGFIIFHNRSLITDKLMFNSSNGDVTYLTDEELPEDYLKTQRGILNNRWKYSKLIMDTDYYSYIDKALGIEIVEPAQTYFVDYSQLTQ